jgi:hypothetical protein
MEEICLRERQAQRAHRSNSIISVFMVRGAVKLCIPSTRRRRRGTQYALPTPCRSAVDNPAWRCVWLAYNCRGSFVIRYLTLTEMRPATRARRVQVAFRQTSVFDESGHGPYTFLL